MKYGNHHLTTVEIVYNVVSFIVAIVTTVAFTVYAKKALRELEKKEANGEDSSSDDGILEMEKLSPERPTRTNSLLPSL